MPLPWEASATNPAQTQLEEALRAELRSATASGALQQATRRFLTPGVASFPWIVEDEAEPPLPFGKIRQASQARFGNGTPTMRRDAASAGRLYEEQWWRVAVELIVEDAAAASTAGTIGVRVGSGANAPRLTAMIGQVISDLFKTPSGRAQLEALGIYNVRETPEGDRAEGALFNFDVQIDVYAEPAAVPV